jgi:hypothetical protein
MHTVPITRGCRGRDCIVVGFITTYAYSAYHQGPPWPWLYSSRIYNYLCIQCLSPLTLWVRIPLRWCVLDTTLCDKVYQWFATGRWFSPGPPVSSTNKTDHHDIAEILLKVTLSTMQSTNQRIQESMEQCILQKPRKLVPTTKSIFTVIWFQDNLFLMKKKKYYFNFF